jgi:DNA-directed RNA polymerase subunit RPC12/RpoP
MVLYICTICNKEFTHKSKYFNHINRINPCKKTDGLNESKMNPNESKMNPNESKMNPNESKMNPNNIIKKEYKCTYCIKPFSSNSNLYKHLKNICKVKKQDDTNKEQIYQQLLNEHLNIKNENEDIKKELIEIKNKLLKGSTINNNSNNINNGTINNIQIIAHGKEDLSKIKENVVLQLVKRGWRSVPMFTEYLHCNDKFPEQKNIYINDINRKYCMIYNGNEWLLKDKTVTIDELYQTKYDFLEENFNVYYDQLEEYQQRSFQKFIKLHEEDVPFVRKIKEELKTLLYNKRDKILNNK